MHFLLAMVLVTTISACASAREDGTRGGRGGAEAEDEKINELDDLNGDNDDDDDDDDENFEDNDDNEDNFDNNDDEDDEENDDNNSSKTASTRAGKNADPSSPKPPVRSLLQEYGVVSGTALTPQEIREIKEEANAEKPFKNMKKSNHQRQMKPHVYGAYHTVRIVRDSAASSSARGSNLNMISFKNTAPRQSEVGFYSHQALEMEVVNERHREFAIRFINCRADPRLVHPLDVSEFHSLIEYIHVDKLNIPRQNITVRFRMRSPADILINQAGNRVLVNFRPRTDGGLPNYILDSL